MHGESLTLRRELGDRQGIAQSLHSLANVAREQGDYSSAQALYKESLAIKQELGDRWGIAGSLEGLAYIASASAGPARAARIWGGAERLREEIGSALPPIDRPGHDLQVAAARSALGDDVAFDRAWQAGRALTLEQAIADALEEQVERP
jgi:hypothetical protein